MRGGVNSEFQKLGPNSAKSAKGFTVIFRPTGGVEYSDASGTIHVDSELLVKPSLGILLYPQSKGFRGVTGSRVEEVLANIAGALEYLANRVEIYRVEKW